MNGANSAVPQPRFLHPKNKNFQKFFELGDSLGKGLSEYVLKVQKILHLGGLKLIIKGIKIDFKGE